ncbi:MAG TPA: enoyl-CoA hydratase/isomerase family protein [Myxococcaceae bacterium]|nr:enoyl-CoA hydratase/isomerase family protein [Myxococcaceae bacterium]
MPSIKPYAHVRVLREDGLLWVRICRPQASNALSRLTLGELGTAFAAHAEEPALKAAVLIGAGDKAFVAGGDLKDFSQIRSVDEAGALFDAASTALDQVRRFPVPVVAALNGVAVGGGAELALACDFRVAVSTASIGYVQARLAITSGFGGGADLMQLLGPSRALRHMFLAQPLEAAQARAWGLVDEITGDGEPLEACVRRFLDPMLRHPPQVIRAYKALAIALREGASRDELRRIEREGFIATWTHPDHWGAVERLLGRIEKESKS